MDSCTSDFKKKAINKVILAVVLGALCGVGTACSVQWAFKNKNSDCGFIKDSDRHRERPDRLDITITQEGAYKPGPK